MIKISTPLRKCYCDSGAVLSDARAQLSRSVAGKIRQTASAIREVGREVADRIQGDVDQQDINSHLKDAQERVDRKTDELNEIVSELLAQSMTELAAHVNQVAESELVKELLPRLEDRVRVNSSAPHVSSDKPSTAWRISDMTRQFGQFIVKHSLNQDVAGSGILGLFRLKRYSSTGTHTLVKDLGHLFDKPFKPWEAVKWTRGVATAGRVLAALRYSSDSCAADQSGCRCEETRAGSSERPVQR